MRPPTGSEPAERIEDALGDTASFLSRELHTSVWEVRRMPLRRVLMESARLALSYQRELDAREQART